MQRKGGLKRGKEVECRRRVLASLILPSFRGNKLLVDCRARPLARAQFATARAHAASYDAVF